jgi:general secretion pathway protein I
MDELIMSHRILNDNHLGFTLLEVLTALVLFTSIGMATYGWINSCLVSLSRVQDQGVRLQASRNALAFISTVNPMLFPAGERELGTFVVRWQSSLLEPVKEGVGHPAGKSLYVLGLYDTHIAMSRQGTDVADFTLRQVGFRQVQDLQVGL